jgi:hypothetical protein
MSIAFKYGAPSPKDPWNPEEIEAVKDVLKPTKKLAVTVSRDTDGRYYSEVVDLNSIRGNTRNAVCIDRQKGKQFNASTVISRAKGLARLLGVECIQDDTYPCKAIIAAATCGCPDCKEDR